MHTSTQAEIYQRIQRGYLDRLEKRVKKMRRFLAERDWHFLRVETIHLKNTAKSFGFPKLSEIAVQLESAIPPDEDSQALTLPEAQRSAELLFAAVDQIASQKVISFKGMT